MWSNRASSATPSMMSLMFSSTSLHRSRGSLVVIFVLQHAAQPRECSRHALACGALVDTARRGHFLEAQVRAEAHQQRVAIARAHMLEQRSRALCALLAAERLFQ